MTKKLVVFKIGEGSFELGFPLSIRLSQDDTNQLLVETEGRLPPAPRLYQSYTQWQSSYRNLASSLRLGASGTQVTNVAVNQCQQQIEQLEFNLNQWLQDSAVQSLLFDLFPYLEPADFIRFVIQTADVRLWQLPWHLWNVWRRYPQTEIALSKPNYQKPSRAETFTLPSKVRILAILGDRHGIEVDRDRRVLSSIPNTEVVFLDQPNLEELTPLWEQSWQILFFAGHSSSNNQNRTGSLQINPYQTIDILQLKYTLAKAIHNGLELAIFNSCDGLGLGYNLADLQLPQTIVMREPVPDQVAQEFLKFFLQAYSNGDTLYQAVKEAKAKIQELYHLEQQAPGSSWLPVICQNLAVYPPLWANLSQKSGKRPSKPFFTFPQRRLFVFSRKWLLIGGAITVTMILGLFGVFLALKFAERLTTVEENSTTLRPIRNPHQGICECPYDYDSVGKLCGKKSAYSRPNGGNPICYQHDVK
jgi:hypothetical protein